MSVDATTSKRPWGALRTRAMTGTKTLLDGSEHNAGETLAVLAEMGILLLGSGGLLGAIPSTLAAAPIGTFRQVGTADLERARIAS